MNDVLSITDAILAPLLCVIIFYFEKSKKDKKIHTNPEYKYYIPGIFVKLFGAISMCFVYTKYYNGGDTVNYYTDAVALSKLLLENPGQFFQILFHGFDRYYTELYYFNEKTGYPVLFLDPKTFFVVRLISVLVIISFHSFITSTMILAWISFGGVWRMYQVFVAEFPQIKGQLAVACLFIPSVFFWGSGILKDTFTFSALGFYFYSFYQLVVKKEKIFKNFTIIVITVYLIISIKPYIFIGILPGSAIFYMRTFTTRMGGTLIRALITPLALLFIAGGGFFLLNAMSSNLGRFSLGNVFQEAASTQRDLKNDFYKGNSFDIGEFDPTPSAMLKKSPLAIEAALFRPFLWETRNIMMFISGVENTFILIFTIILLVKTRIFGFFKYIGNHNLLSFCLIFSLFFAFSVGISTSNFGSLVRYRIPLLPFYLSTLYIINFYYKTDKARRLNMQYEGFSAYA